MDAIAKTEKVPKAQNRRVRKHLHACILALRMRNLGAGFEPRPASRTISLIYPTWELLDALTLALDLCEEESLRVLVSQARTVALKNLVKQSSHLKSSRRQHSLQAN